MRIWFDIVHIAQLNFYLNAIKSLSQNNEVAVTLINRGKLVVIAEKELKLTSNCHIVPVGKHKGNKFSAIFDANILRLFKLFNFYLKFKPNISVGNGFLHGIIGQTAGIPSLMFGDDIERSLDVKLKTIFSTEMHYVTGSLDFKSYKNISVYNALKEWAYLSPNYFKPNKGVLIKYNLEADKYIFVREVITGTLNYNSQRSNLVASIAKYFPKNYTILLSLEDKTQIGQYPEDWVVLKEPIEDIHSLIYFSRLLISSGDSMAREAAMMGVQSVYCGVREMNANKVLINEGALIQKKIEEVPDYIEHLLKNSDDQEKEEFRDKLNNKWIDVTGFIEKRILNYKK